jgi:hypothetical protein
MDVDPSGLFVAGAGADRWIRLFDFYSGECIGKVAGHSGMITGVKFTRDGRRLVSTGADGTVFVWRLAPELTKAMQERVSEITARELAAEEAGRIREEEESAAEQRQKLKVQEVPGWARTVKGAKDAPKVAAKGKWAKGGDEAPQAQSGKDLEALLPPPPAAAAEAPPPPPPPPATDEEDA